MFVSTIKKDRAFSILRVFHVLFLCSIFLSRLLFAEEAQSNKVNRIKTTYFSQGSDFKGYGFKVISSVLSEEDYSYVLKKFKENQKVDELVLDGQTANSNHAPALDFALNDFGSVFLSETCSMQYCSSHEKTDLRLNRALASISCKGSNFIKEKIFKLIWYQRNPI